MKNREEELDGIDDEAQAIAMQKMINSGTVWHLEGAMGRAAMDFINAGLCMLGVEGHKDFWGNYVPGRYEVKAGTKGSYDFVVDHHGVEWADLLSKEGEK
jgi:hypothetical protein